MRASKIVKVVILPLLASLSWKQLEIDRQFANRNCYRLSRVSWALAQISSWNIWTNLWNLMAPDDQKFEWKNSLPLREFTHFIWWIAQSPCGQRDFGRSQSAQASDRPKVAATIPHTPSPFMTIYIKQVIWAKLTWRATAAILPLWQSMYSDKILMRLERVHKFEVSVRKTPWI